MLLIRTLFRPATRVRDAHILAQLDSNECRVTYDFRISRRSNHLAAARAMATSVGVELAGEPMMESPFALSAVHAIRARLPAVS